MKVQFGKIKFYLRVRADSRVGSSILFWRIYCQWCLSQEVDTVNGGVLGVLPSPHCAVLQFMNGCSSGGEQPAANHCPHTPTHSTTAVDSR